MREWLNNTLRGELAITDIVGTRIHQASDVEAVPTQPFIIFTFGLRTNARVGPASRWPFQVWAHDELGSYIRIDLLLDLIRDTLLTAPTPDEILQVHWLEDSGDLRDDEMRTITRFSRFQLAMATGGGE